MDPDHSQPLGDSIDGVRPTMDAVSRHPRLATPGIQPSGTKGHDGLQGAVSGEPPSPVGPTDPLDILIAHDAWATRALLDVCAGLRDEHWHQRFDIGPGSLHDTLTHIVGARLRWADRIHGPPREPRLSIDGASRRTVPELTTMFEEAAADLAAAATAARRRGLATVCDVTLGGESFRFTLAAMIVHVTTHGMHHRAQCLNMLHRLSLAGVSDRLPEIDVLDYALRHAEDRVTPSR